MATKGKKTTVPKKKANAYKMPAPITAGEVIHDTIGKKKWRIGPSIGIGGFGEIYSACDHEKPPKSSSSYPYVIKIEPHENGPLFVEKHFYVRNANKDDIAKYMSSKKLSCFGMPTYFGNGSHEYKGAKYRYLVLERYGKDVWSLFKDNGRSFPSATVFQIGVQMLDVLEYIHNRGYVHADIKGANILMGLKKGTENQAYLVDFGLATRVNDKEFKPDPKCAHNGTIEYTSRDAHVGVPTMRGDLEILGYNMLQWLVGELPWEKSLKQPKIVQDMKESFMKNVRSNISKQFNNVPEALIKFFEYINTMKPKDIPDYAKCKQLFESYLKSLGKNKNSKMVFTPQKETKNNKRSAAINGNDSTDETDEVTKTTKPSPKKRARVGRTAKVIVSDSENEEEIKGVNNTIKENAPKAKKGTKPKAKEPSPASEDCENEEPDSSSSAEVVKKYKRKSIEHAESKQVKKVKRNAKSTPPAKKNHAHISTQTSVEKKRSPRLKVSFDSPICEVIGEKKPCETSKQSLNSSRDIFEDSYEIEQKKMKPKKKLISDEETLVKRVVKKKVTTTTKTKSWKNTPAIMNGRSPPK